MAGLTAAALLALLVTQAVSATPVRVRTPYEVKESHFVPRGWKKLDRAPENHVIDLQIGVKQGNFAALEKQLYEVSDPSHERYGQHLSAEDVRELVKPSDESLSLVHEWLDAHGIAPSAYSSAKDWIKVSLPVDAVERLLDTEYHTYEHADGTRVVRAPRWSLPRNLHGHIDTVQPTTSFFRARANKYDYIDAPVSVSSSYVAPSDETLCKVCNVSSVTPECFETLYGTKGYKVQAAGENQIAFANYLGEHPIRTDLEKFLAKYRPEGISQARDFEQLVLQGGPGDYPLTPGELARSTSKEANLDVQAIAGINWETPIVSYSTGGSPPFDPSKSTPVNTNEPYLDWVNFLLDLDSIPQVISTSYSDDEQTVPRAYAERVCAQFAAVGARGTSLLFASGDDGVGADGACVSNDGTNSTRFLAGFPPSCPYVTAVGATMEFEPEVVAYRPASAGHGAYTSGGGFSNYFPTPRYQRAEVAAYVEGLGDAKYDGLYNASGRAYPDVAAQGLYFAYFWNGTEGVISGTSASTPLLSGIVSLVNDARLAAGRPPLGWLNPWLYSEGYKGLSDVTSGSAHGCGVEGFPAVEGWDPVTGLGTPNFPALVKLAGGRFHGN
ncbi:hypothetical protein DL764_001097 [Monosporascus ibericus]|uniref:tripeptidyl-peptidase II n=1 Tax=Monosporascus ibericus TaxID=155417 RepID=A0A4Q4TSK8_9PEZI|nr:hypothetical protein DL764_001097 [Monosporascus ibericus]